MEEQLTEEELAWQMLAAEDMAVVLRAQRLAAMDPDIRYALTDMWWVAIRATLIAHGVRHYVPIPCPFSASQMQAYADRRRELYDNGGRP